MKTASADLFHMTDHSACSSGLLVATWLWWEDLCLTDLPRVDFCRNKTEINVSGNR